MKKLTILTIISLTTITCLSNNINWISKQLNNNINQTIPFQLQLVINNRTTNIGRILKECFYFDIMINHITYSDTNFTNIEKFNKVNSSNPSWDDLFYYWL